MTTLQQPTEPEAAPDAAHDPASDGCATAPTATQKVAQAKVVMRSVGSVVVPDEWDLEELSDHDLLAQLALDTRISQALAARSREAMEVYRRRRRADEAARREQDRSFTLTATEATVLEVAPLLGTDPGRVQTLVRETKMLIEDFPGLWQLCRTGRLEVYKARLVAEAALSRLTDADDVAALDASMTAWLRASLASGDADDSRDSGDLAGFDDAEGAGGARPGGLVPRTVKQIRNRTGYVLTKMRPRQAEERFADAYRARAARVAPSPDEDGTGSLTLTHAWPLLQLADRHLSLLARQDRGPDDERTLAQARADTLVGLLTGRLFVTQRAHSAPDVPAHTLVGVVGGVAVEAVAGSLARARAAGFAHPADAPLSRWPAPLQLRRALSAPSHARPVINVTVPVQTLMGVTDDPGVAAGGGALPAGLVRLLAADPAATWYRMLTDPARGTVELSTTSYQPAAPIWRQVVADWQTCYQPACTQPATTVELDHRVPWPAGQTSTTGLEPACKRDHKAKHATGFRLQRRHQGDPASRALQLTTPAGFAHRADPAAPPVGDGWGPAWRYEHPYTPAEVRDALDHLHHTGTQLVESLETMLAEEARQRRITDPDASDTDAGIATGASRRWGNRDALHHQWLLDEGIHR